MQAHEILQEVKQSGLSVEGFWYIYSLVVTSLLVLLIVSIIYLVKGFLLKFQADIKVTHEQFAQSIKILTETTTELASIVKLHENEFVHVKEDISELKESKHRRRS